MKIEQCKLGHLEDIEKLCKKKKYNINLKALPFRTFVALEEMKIIGFISVHVDDSYTMGFITFLCCDDVDDKDSIIKALIEEVIKACKKCGCVNILAATQPKTMIDRYCELGFMVGGDKQTHLIYKAR